MLKGENLKNIFMSGALLSIAIVIGRIFGFLREILIASTYGKTYEADIVTLSLLFPDLFVNLLLGGAFSAAFLPAFIAISKSQSLMLIKKLHYIFGGLSLLFTIIIFFSSGYLTTLIAPSLNNEAQESLSFLLKVTCWSIPFIVCTSITTTALNAKEVFFFPALGTSLINISVCIGIILVHFVNKNMVFIISISIILGSLMRWLLQAVPIYLDKLREKILPTEFPFEGKIIFSRYAHALISTSVLILFPIFARYYMLKTGEGQLANLNYAQKIIDIIANIVSGSIAIVLAPMILKGNNYKFIGIMGIIIIVGAICMATIYYSVSPFLAENLFGYGAFNLDAVKLLTLHMQSSAFTLAIYTPVFYLINTLSYTGLSHKSAISCYVGFFGFIIFIQLNLPLLTYDIVYQGITFGFLITLVFQLLFIGHAILSCQKINVNTSELVASA